MTKHDSKLPADTGPAKPPGHSANEKNAAENKGSDPKGHTAKTETDSPSRTDAGNLPAK